MKEETEEAQPDPTDARPAHELTTANPASQPCLASPVLVLSYATTTSSLAGTEAGRQAGKEGRGQAAERERRFTTGVNNGVSPHAKGKERRNTYTRACMFVEYVHRPQLAHNKRPPLGYNFLWVCWETTALIPPNYTKKWAP